jgi:GrpB-like predicted nucleotidyltransferase (UPF0157 family)
VRLRTGNEHAAASCRVLADYDTDWPNLAAAYAEGLENLGPVLLEVHRIGSTSVPGLSAKPVIDLMPLVTSLGSLDQRQSRIEALGYCWHGEYGIAGRRYCALTNETGARAARLHFFEPDSPHVERHFAFRDYLRAHPEVASAYVAEKRRAQDLYPLNSHAYSEEKGAWIRSAQEEAIVWRSREFPARGA